MKTHWKILGVAVAVTLLGVTVLGAVAFAQGPRGGPPFWSHKWGGFEKAGEYRQQMQIAMADALGISVEDLEAAQRDGKSISEIAEEQGKDLAELREDMMTARQGGLEQAVADGLLTQGQADTIQERAGGAPFPPNFGRPVGPRGRIPVGFFGDGEQSQAHHEQMRTAMAGMLGLSVDELDATLADGKSLVEIAEEQGVDTADLQGAMKSAGEEMLKQAVTDGRLTQEQADKILEHVDMGPFRPGGRGMYGSRHGFPGCRNDTN